MNWSYIESPEQVDKIIQEESGKGPVLIYKHSPRCSICQTVRGRLERSWDSQAMKEVKTYIVDVLKAREASNLLATSLGVTHESPQVFVLKEGKMVYTASQLSIDYPKVGTALLE